jgi:hypothetical protein
MKPHRTSAPKPGEPARFFFLQNAEGRRLFGIGVVQAREQILGMDRLGQYFELVTLGAGGFQQIGGRGLSGE